MAGSITVSSITLDSDNNFSIKSNTGATLFFANTTGIDIANSIGATAITNDKILSVANTQITGNIASSQITSNPTLYGNVSVTGTLSATGGVTATGLTDKIQPITASVAASALTITLNPTILDFRASPLTSGTVTTIAVPAAISVVIPSTSTMGTVSAQQSRIVVIAINNAGTVELAAVNISGGSVLDETTLITTTAAVAAGNSATAYYSTTARTGVAYRVVGYVESTQTTAGTWATAPSTIQGYGGQALAAMSSLGYGQTWQTVTRSIGTTYYNTTGKPICVNINFTAGGSVNSGFVLTVGGYQYLFGSYSTGYGSITQVIPANMSYIAEQNSSAATFGAWRELR
jgi:hypothetical protein